MTWNYRVLCRRDNAGEPYFAVHEVYYDEDGKPTSWTCDAVCPTGDNLLEVAINAGRMVVACGMPPLCVADDNTLHEYKPDYEVPAHCGAGGNADAQQVGASSPISAGGEQK